MVHKTESELAREAEKRASRFLPFCKKIKKNNSRMVV